MIIVVVALVLIAAFGAAIGGVLWLIDAAIRYAIGRGLNL